MARPIVTTTGICFAFPDVLQTPIGTGQLPIPYPNIAQLSTATGTATNVNAGGQSVVLEDSEIPAPTSGGEPGTGGGAVQAGEHLGACSFTSFSATVKANGKGVVRQFDTTSQNGGNTTGLVMVGLPTVLVGD